LHHIQTFQLFVIFVKVQERFMGGGVRKRQPEVVERQLVLTKRGSVPLRLNLTTRLTRFARCQQRDSCPRWSERA